MGRFLEKQSLSEAAWRHAEGSEVWQVVREVRRVVDLDDAELGDEFFRLICPSHLSTPSSPLASLQRTSGTDHRKVLPSLQTLPSQSGSAKPPPVDEQETLTNLIDHYEELGPSGMQEQIVKSRYCSPGTRILKSENVRRAAVELRRIEIETIQDVVSKRPDEIKCMLRSLYGIGDRRSTCF